MKRLIGMFLVFFLFPMAALAVESYSSSQVLSDAVVGSTGDYKSLQSAIAAGRKRIHVRNGTYSLSGDLSIPSGTWIIGESRDGVIIDTAGYSLKIMGTGTRYFGEATNPYAGAAVVTEGSALVTFVADETGGTAGTIPGRSQIIIDRVVKDIASITHTPETVTMMRAWEGPSRTFTKYYEVVAANAKTRLERLTIRRTGPKVGAERAIVVVQTAEDLMLDDLDIIGPPTPDVDGIYGQGNYRCVLTRLNVRSCGVRTEPMSAGIDWRWASDCVIAHTNISDAAQCGILMRASWNCVLANNTTANCFNSGYWSCENSRTCWNNNVARNCTTGMTISGEMNQISNNVLVDCEMGIYRAESPEWTSSMPDDNNEDWRTGTFGGKTVIAVNTIIRPRHIGVYAWSAGNIIANNVIDQGGYLQNGRFEHWIFRGEGLESWQPYFWEATAGAWGTSYSRIGREDAVKPLFSAWALKITRGTLGDLAFRQRFHFPLPADTYDIRFWARKDAGATGNITVRICDEQGNVKLTTAAVPIGTELSSSEWRAFGVAGGADITAQVSSGWYLEVVIDTFGAGSAIYLDGVAVHRHTGSGIQVAGSRTTLIGNAIVSCGGNDRAAIYFSKPYLSSGGYNNYIPEDGGIVAGNFIDQSGGDAVFLNQPGTVFTGNYVKGCGLGKAVVRLGDVGIKVAGNHLDGLYSAQYGITSANASGTFIVTNTGADIENNSILNVTCRGGGGGGVAAAFIYGNAVTNWKIIGNTFQGTMGHAGWSTRANGYGINLNGASTGWTISGNRFTLTDVYAALETSTTASDLLLQGNTVQLTTVAGNVFRISAPDVQVVGNSVKTDSAGGALYARGSGARCHIVGNRVSGTGIAITVNDCVVADNTVSGDINLASYNIPTSGHVVTGNQVAGNIVNGANLGVSDSAVTGNRCAAINLNGAYVADPLDDDRIKNVVLSGNRAATIAVDYGLGCVVTGNIGTVSLTNPTSCVNEHNQGPQ